MSKTVNSIIPTREPESDSTDADQSVIEYTWKARSMRLSTILYVVAVFVGFMALAQFVFHSFEAVKALLFTAIGSIGVLIPQFLIRIEYRFTDTGLAKRRAVKAKKPQAFKDVFLWDQLSHLIPTKTGFKYYKRVEEAGLIKRFLELHVSDKFSGEFHVESEDRERVRAIIDLQGIQTTKPLKARN